MIMMVNNISGWWLAYPSNDGVKVIYQRVYPILSKHQALQEREPKHAGSLRRI